MLRAEAYEALGSRPGVASVRVIVTSDAGGVQSVTLLDRDRNPLPPGTFTPGGCPAIYPVPILEILSNLLPIYLRGEECGANAPPPILGPFLYQGSQPDGADLPCPPPGLVSQPSREPSAACREAMGNVGVLRELLLRECTELGERARERNVIRNWMIGAWLAFVLLGVFGFVSLAAVAFAAALALSVAFVFAERALREAAERIRILRERFHAARDRVTTSCCSGDFAQEILDDPC